MKAYLESLRYLWREIDELVPHGPPGIETGGQLSFVLFFGGLAIFIAAMIAGAR